MQNFYIIASNHADHEKIYWSNKSGWVSLRDATQYTQETKEALGGAISGTWELVHHDLSGTLEALIDKHGMAELCESLDQICIEKANEIRAKWLSGLVEAHCIEHARALEYVSKKLYFLAKECKEMSI